MKLFGKKVSAIEKHPLFSKRARAHASRMFNKTGHAIMHDIIKPIGSELTENGLEMAGAALLGSMAL